MMVVAVVVIARSRNLFGVIVLGGLYSFLMATVLVALDAVDVAMTEASVGAGISTVLMLGALYLGWIGLRLLLARPGGASGPVRIANGHYGRQAFLITLLNPKAIVFYMAFFPLFIDPATHRGLVTFVAMAATIATITLVYGLLLCSFAQAIGTRVRAHRRLAQALERLTGIFLIGFGIRLGSQ